MTDGVTDNIVWILGARMPGSIPGSVPKKEKRASILYMYYISYM